MGETWFVSDSHFSHKNILEYEKEARPFASIEEMNETMIERWNNVVGKHDKVFHLGDFCFGRANIAIAGRLNGSIRLIMGNHDIYGVEEYKKYFVSLHGVRFWNDFILTHVPVHPDSLPGRAKANLHGHCHSKNIMFYSPTYDDDLGYIEYQPDPRYVCCSVEQNNLTPINADIILQRFKND